MSTRKTAKHSLISRWRDAVVQQLSGPALDWILLAFFCFWGIWQFNVSLTGDQKVHLSEAVEMFARGKWAIPTLFGENSYYKPPATHWLLLGSWKLFGFSYGAAVLPFALALFAAAVLFAQVVGAPWAGFFLIGNVASLMFGFTTQMEVLLLFCVVAITWCLQRERWFAAWTLVGLAALVKSPTYSVLFGASVFAWALLSKKRRALRARGFMLGVPWALLLGLSWYAWVYCTDRDAFVAQYLVREHANKLRGNGIGFFQMVGEFLLLCLPITALLPLALFRPDRMSVILSAPLLVFLAWTPYRMDTYLYPLLPLLLWQALRQLPRAQTLLRAQGVVVWVALLALLPLLYSSRVLSLPALIAMAGGATVYAWASHPAHVRVLGWSAAFLIFIVRLSAQNLGEQDVTDLRELARAHPHVQWRMYDATHDIWHETGYLSTAIGHAIERVHSAAEITAAIRAGQWIIVDGAGTEKIIAEVRKQVALHAYEWKRWKRGIYRPSLREFLTLQQMPQTQWEEKNQKTFWILAPTKR